MEIYNDLETKDFYFAIAQDEETYDTLFDKFRPVKSSGYEEFEGFVIPQSYIKDYECLNDSSGYYYEPMMSVFLIPEKYKLVKDFEQAFRDNEVEIYELKQIL